MGGLIFLTQHITNKDDFFQGLTYHQEIVFQQFYKSSLVKKKLFDLIEIYSQNYEYSLKEIKINNIEHRS